MARPKHRSAADKARALNCDPFQYLCERFNELPTCKRKDEIALEIMPYCYPKLKAIDLKTDGGMTVNVVIGGADDLPTGGETAEDKEGGGGV